MGSNIVRKSTERLAIAGNRVAFQVDSDYDRLGESREPERVDSVDSIVGQVEILKIVERKKGLRIDGVNLRCHLVTLKKMIVYLIIPEIKFLKICQILKINSMKRSEIIIRQHNFLQAVHIHKHRANL